jgi:uncharacterized protein (TIGR02391 family)
VQKRRRASEPEQFTEIKHFRSADEISASIEKLTRRITEVKALKDLRYSDQRIKNIALNIRKDVLEIFGANSPEYGEHRFYEIWDDKADRELGLSGEPGMQVCFEAGIPQTVWLLDGLIARLREKLDDLKRDAPTRARSAFEYMDLHPRIGAVSSELYRDCHYRQAVLDASIALVNYVKEKSRRHELDGASLMSTVFSPNSPVLAFNALADQTDKDEQQGMMHLFMGAVLALRNPRAHSVFDDSPELALDAIALLSMLAKRLDSAKGFKRRLRYGDPTSSV